VDLRCPSSCAVRLPQFSVAACINAAEQHHAIVISEPRRVEAVRPHPGDSQLLRAGDGSVRYPELCATRLVEAAEQDLAVVDGEVARSEPGDIGANYAGHLVRAGGRPVRHP
jgi:hypothetical protein